MVEADFQLRDFVVDPKKHVADTLILAIFNYRQLLSIDLIVSNVI